MATRPPITDMQELMASVGWVMLHWCFLEDSLTDALRELRIESGKSANLIRDEGSFSGRLKEWRGLLSEKTDGNPQLAETVADLATVLQQLLRTRNRIAHNLAGANASLDDDDQPYIWCAQREASNPGVEPDRITLADLRAMIEAMERCRNRLRTIGLQG